MSQNSKNLPVIANYLASAFDIEDQMSQEIYGPFLESRNWPVGLSDDAFRAIVEQLNILIKETKEHKEQFLALKRRIKDEAA